LATQNETKGFFGGRSQTNYFVVKAKSGTPCDVRIENKVNLKLIGESEKEIEKISMTLMWGDSLRLLPQILR